MSTVANRPTAPAQFGPEQVCAPVGAAGSEARPADAQHASLRLWLRMFSCTQMIEREVRARLREEFGITLGRFDLIAQLERHPRGLRMGELSRRLMVTGGNVTGLVAALVDEGLLERRGVPGDRRAHVVRLTRKGKRAFDPMARAHERWIIAMLGALPQADRARLHAMLGRLKTTLRPAPEATDRWT